MRFRRLSIRNFRGVEACDVEFLTTGVTVVAGPNEIGKSSLGEAIDLLFEYADSSGAAAVKAVQPVHRDEGTLVSLEFETGPYRATYTKCFNRNKRTELEIHAPRPESLVGREAHDRVKDILDTTVDTGLWRALRIQQGVELKLPDGLGKHASLAAALDRAAGQARAGESEASLFEAVRAEYERFYTASGKERAPLTDAAKEVEQCSGRLDGLDAELRAIEHDVSECVRLDAEIGSLERDVGERKAAADAWAEGVQALERQERELDTLASKRATAALTHEQAASRLQARRELIRRAHDAHAEHQRLLEKIQASTPDLARRRHDEGEARRTLQDAQEVFRAAEAHAQVAAGDLEFRRAELDHELLSKRLERIRAAEAERGAAASVLEGNRVTPARLAEIREAHLGVERASAALEAGSPDLQVEALRPLELRDASGPSALEAGARWARKADEPLEITLGDIARVRVVPTAGQRELRQGLESARTRYAEALRAAGVQDLAGAVQAENARTEAERTIATSGRVIAENLHDLTPDQLAHKVGSLAAAVRAHPAERASDAPLPADFDDAQDRARASRSRADAARRARDEAEAALAPLKAALEAVERTVRDSDARAKQQDAQLQAERAALEAARRERTDAELEAAGRDAAAALELASAVVSEAEARLAAADPEGTRALARNAEEAHASTQHLLTGTRTALTKVRTRLELAGEKGLSEARAEAQAQLRRAERKQDSIRRQAAAARMLFEVLRDRRDAARRAYVQPLTERIDRLGSYVFGPGFGTELDQDLAVVSRTLNGRTVPFTSLSGGAREQISLLTRIACAMIVAPDGGVPLIFDDALGHSDAQRLTSLGAVLATAGKACQVIVLTCAPERYRNVGAASHIALDGANPSDRNPLAQEA